MIKDIKDERAENIRRMVAKKIEENPDVNMASLSLAIGANAAYLQQYLKRGIPMYLPETKRHILAGLLKIPPETLSPINAEKHTTANKTNDYTAIINAILDALILDEADRAQAHHLLTEALESPVQTPEGIKTVIQHEAQKYRKSLSGQPSKRGTKFVKS